MASTKLGAFFTLSWMILALSSFPYVVTRPPRQRSRPCLTVSDDDDNSSSPHIRINYHVFRMAHKTPSHVQTVRLFCKTGYFLEVTNRKRISGTLNSSKESIFFESQSYGTSIVRLRNLVSGRFLAINSKGRITTQAKITGDSLLKTMHEENLFHTFSSHKYFKEKHHDLFIGIKQNGRSKPPNQTSAGQIAVQFILLEKRNDSNIQTKAKILTAAKRNLVNHSQRDMG